MSYTYTYKNKKEPFRSSLYWDLWKIVYYQKKVLGGAKVFGKQQESEDLN